MSRTYHMFVTTCFVVCLFAFTCGEIFPYVNDKSCSPNMFFNTANQKCETCNVAESVPSNDSLSCVCKEDFKVTFPNSGGAYFGCAACINKMTCGLTATACDGNEVRLQKYLEKSFFPVEECVACSEVAGYSSQTITCEYKAAVPVSSNVVGNTDPAFIKDNLPKATLACSFRTTPNIQACQLLANLCVMQMYNPGGSACRQYVQVFSNRGISINDIATWVNNLPMIFYTSIDPSLSDLVDPLEVRQSLAITGVFNYYGNNSVLDLLVMKYDFDGKYLGSESAELGSLQICPDRPTSESKAFRFGTSFRQSCILTFEELFDKTKYPPVMYDVNLRFTDHFDEMKYLYPIPVRIIAEEFPYNEDDAIPARWRLVRRFFLVDSVTSEQEALVRFASSFSLRVSLTNSENGSIYPPLITIKYSTMHMSNESEAAVDFALTYYTEIPKETFQIVISLFGIGGFFFAFLKTNGWMRRQGLRNMDCSGLLALVHFMCGHIANALFVVAFGYAVVTMVSFKSEKAARVVPPDENQIYLFEVMLFISFSFKLIEVVMMIFFQSFIDMFLIDWERPVAQNAKVSIWRTYFVAREWNDLQIYRKTSTTFQLIILLGFLETFGFKSLALLTPNSSLNQTLLLTRDYPDPVYHEMLRFGIAGLLFFPIGFAQIIYNSTIHERFFHDKIRGFVDLCSVANELGMHFTCDHHFTVDMKEIYSKISLFILANKQFGYYIHGRSVHGKADTDMVEMHAMFKKEEANLVPRRGLESDSELQTFIMYMSERFRAEYDKIYHPLQVARNKPRIRGDETVVKEKFHVYGIMRSFLRTFLDHTIRDQNYVTKDRGFMENLLDMEFEDTDPVLCYFNNDPRYSFTNNLFYGREWTLLIFEFLLFGVVDYHQFNYPLAAAVTYIVSQFLAHLRLTISRSNLSKKILVDKRFLY